jgi:hypothetical protein
MGDLAATSHVPEPRAINSNVGGEMDDWDHFEELDDASTWSFGSCRRKRIARRRCGVSMRGRRMQTDHPICYRGAAGAMV